MTKSGGEQGIAPDQPVLSDRLLEQSLLDALEASPRKVRLGNAHVGAIGGDELFKLLKRYGYLTEEIATALRLLAARRMVIVDKKGTVAQLIDSPEERRELINTRITELETALHRFEVAMPHQDIREYRTKLLEVSQKVDRASSSRELELVHDEAMRLADRLDHVVSLEVDTARRLVTDLLLASERRVESGLASSERAVPGKNVMAASGGATDDNPWSRHAERLREELDTRSDEVSKGVTDLLGRGSWVLAEGDRTTGQLDKLDLFLAGHRELEAAWLVLSQHADAAVALASTVVEWTALLGLAERTRQQAETCATIFGTPTFSRQYEAIEADAPISIEPAMGPDQIAAATRGRLQMLEAAMHDWLTAQRDNFLTLRGEREQTLARLAGSRVSLHSSYDQHDPAASFANLASEVHTQLGLALLSLEAELTRVKGDLSYLYVIADIVPGTLPDPARLESAFSALRNELIADEFSSDLLASWTNRFDQLRVGLNEIRDSISVYLVKQEPTEREQTVLSLLQSGKSLELGNIVRAIVRSQGADITFDEVVSDVQSLFRKNQIIVKVERRQ